MCAHIVLLNFQAMCSLTFLGRHNACLSCRSFKWIRKPRHRVPWTCWMSSWDWGLHHDLNIISYIKDVCDCWVLLWDTKTWILAMKLECETLDQSSPQHKFKEAHVWKVMKVHFTVGIEDCGGGGVGGVYFMNILQRRIYSSSSETGIRKTVSHGPNLGHHLFL